MKKISLLVLLYICLVSCSQERGSKTWIEKPAGKQCEAIEFNNIDEAIAELTNNSITVYDQNEASHIVVTLCGAGTSKHFQAKISKDDLKQARLLDWNEI